MSASDSPTPTGLYPEQQARFTMAAADLATARAIDLGAIPRPQLLIEFERLRGSLDDALQLILELAETRTGQ